MPKIIKTIPMGLMDVHQVDGMHDACQEGSSGGAVNSSGLYTAPNTTGTFHVIVTSTQDSSKSATAVVYVVAGSSTPTLYSLSTSPSSPIVGQQFTVTINGSGFNTSTSQILVYGTACNPCTVPNNVLTTRTSSQIIGPGLPDLLYQFHC